MALVLSFGMRTQELEVCVRVASRLAMFRDKPGQLAYELPGRKGSLKIQEG